MVKYLFILFVFSLPQACFLKSKNASTLSACLPSDEACLNNYQPKNSCDVEYSPEQANLRALTNEEIGNVISDVFNFDASDMIRELPRRDQGTKFQNAVLLSPLSESFLSKWQNTALSLATLLVEKPESIGRFTKLCEATQAGTADCASRMVKDLSRSLWRRPADTESEGRLVKLYTNGTEPAIDQKERMIRLIAALLIDPRFLYKFEYLRGPENESAALDSYEVAARLAFFIWRSNPDEILLDRAAKGEMVDPRVISEETNRMLEDTRAMRAFKQFVREWLLLDNLSNLQLVGSVSNFGALRELTYSRTRDVLFDGAGGINLALTGGGDVSQSLISQPAVIGGLSVGASTSPVKRGLFVNDRFLCRKIPPPPPNAGIFKAETIALDVTPRERFRVHEENAACASCHAAIDGIGLSLESFDVLGQKRSQYPNGKPIDTSGTIRLNGEVVAYNSAEEMIQLIGTSRDAESCFTGTMVEYAWGVQPGEENSCELGKISRSLVGRPHNWKSLVRTIVQHPSFITRARSQP